MRPLHHPAGGPPPPFARGRIKARSRHLGSSSAKRGRGTRRSLVEGAQHSTPKPRAAGGARIGKRTTAEPGSGRCRVPGDTLPGRSLAPPSQPGFWAFTREVPGRLAECPTAAECPSRPDRALHASPVALRRPRTMDARPRQQIKAAGYLFLPDPPGLAWGNRRRPTQPRHPGRSFATVAWGWRWRYSTGAFGRGDKQCEISDKRLNALRNF